MSRWTLLSFFLAILNIIGCDRDQLRVPYIPPTLANWPQPYRGVSGLKLHAFNSGFLRLPEAAVLRHGSMARTRLLAVPVFLIEHPKHGLILFNTGLRPQPPRAPGDWTGALMRTVAFPGETLTDQLQHAGFKPEAVRWIVLSTMRFDHTGGLTQFSDARVVVAKAEHEHGGRAPVGYVPADFARVANWKFIDFAPAVPLATFDAHVDLFGDGSCVLIDAGGATPGTMAMLVRLPQRPVLLADDLAALEESVRHAARPASSYDVQRWWQHIWQLKRFKDLWPQLLVIPGHDLKALQSVSVADVIPHELAQATPIEPPTPTPGRLWRLLPWR
jgi:N-acyl homoserine lactone hydrolase